MTPHRVTYRATSDGFASVISATWQTEAQAEAHSVAIHTMHYNFVRIHQTLRCTPAMAAGVSATLWELTDMVKVLEAWEASKDA